MFEILFVGASYRRWRERRWSCSGRLGGYSGGPSKGVTTLAGSLAGLLLTNSIRLPYLQITEFEGTVANQIQDRQK